MEERFNAWYNEKLIPSIRSFEGLIEATRFQLNQVLHGDGDYPEYIAVYKYRNKQAFEAWFSSPQVSAAVEEFLGMVEAGEVELKCHLLYEHIKTW